MAIPSKNKIQKILITPPKPELMDKYVKSANFKLDSITKTPKSQPYRPLIPTFCKNSSRWLLTKIILFI